MPAPSYRHWIARSLARAVLAGPRGADAAALQARMAAALGESPPWLAQAAQGLAQWSAPAWAQADLDSLGAHLAALPGLQEALVSEQVPRIRRLILRPPQMRPRPLGLDDCALPALQTPADLAACLGLEPARLDWLTSPTLAWRTDHRRNTCEHYHAHLHAKAQRGVRLIEAPKADLKQAQRRLLAEVLHRVPPHEAAWGFVPGRSVAGHAAAHAGQAFVMRFDLKDFFPSISAARIHALWHTLGYPPALVRTLTALCTTRTPRPVLDALRERQALDWWGAKRLAAAHLPQGAPTSPALANLCAFRLDLRLDGLAWAFSAHYTRYADDLVFSGPAALRQRSGALRAWVAGIVADEGFTLHPDKTRAMPRHQQQRVAGVVVNERPNMPRLEYERLKAALHQSALHGPGADAAAELRAQLLGRVAWAAQLNPARGEKLQRLFDRIVWPA